MTRITTPDSQRLKVEDPTQGPPDSSPPHTPTQLFDQRAIHGPWTPHGPLTTPGTGLAGPAIVSTPLVVPPPFSLHALGYSPRPSLLEISGCLPAVPTQAQPATGNATDRPFNNVSTATPPPPSRHQGTWSTYSTAKRIHSFCQGSFTWDCAGPPRYFPLLHQH